MTQNGVALSDVDFEESEEQLLRACCFKAAALAEQAHDTDDRQYCELALDRLKKHITNEETLSSDELQKLLARLERIDRGE